MNPPSSATPSVEGALSIRRVDGRNELAIRLSLVLVFLLLFLLFSLLRPGQFPTSTNISAIISQQGIAALAAMAITVTLTVGEFDLSIGGIIGIVALVGAWGFGQGWNSPTVGVAGLAAAVLVGGINATLVVAFRLTSFIATLGVSMLLSGLALMITGGATLYRGIPQGYHAIATTRILGVPSLAWLILLVAVALWYILDCTPAGRFLRATGSGREAASLIGIRTDRYIVAAFLLAALVAGIAGLLLISNNGAVSTTAGQNYTLPAYAAAFLGATSVRPVRFNVFGSAMGVLVLSIGVSGLTMIGAPIWVPAVFNAVALIFALLFARWLSAKAT
jgi:ribose transport system permease protein